MYYFDGTYILVILAFFITLGSQILIDSRYRKYKQEKNNQGIRGCDVAREILDKNGLSGIKIQEVSGNLSDHYDPIQKTINLSTDIYRDSSVAAAAVAAHECGHAIQDKEGYSFLRFRRKLVPTVNLCSKLGYFVIVLGFLFGYFEMAMIGLILLGAILLFELVTLPVEFNASKRAKKQLETLDLVDNRGIDGVDKMLRAAALTYVASLASTLLQMLRMLLIILGSRRDDQ